MIDRLIMKNTNIQAISLFSGAGGLDIGAKQNNIKLKVSIDNDEDSVRTLELNSEFKETKIIKDDIKKTKVKEKEK